MENQKFRGNPHHLSLLTDAVNKDDIASWNALVRKGGSSFKPRLAGADLSGLEMREIRLDGADLSDANLSGSDLSRANLSGARLRGCDLSEADLSGARLIHTDFSNADLRKARLTGARAHGALFTGADVSGTHLEKADLSRASMQGASVSGTSKSGIKKKIRIKVKSVQPEETENVVTEFEGEISPWIRAQYEEKNRRELRTTREAQKVEDEKVKLDRKLGRKKPLFKRVK